MRFGNTNNLLMGEQSTGNEGLDLASLAAIQGMFGFASQPALNTSGSTLPQLIGGPTTTQGVPVGPNTPPQYTGGAQGRPVPGTQLAPQGQPPAVRATGGAPAVRGTSGAPMKIAQKVGTAAKASRFASPGSIAYTAADLGTAALTGKGITQRIVEPIAESLAELYYGDGNLLAFSPEELAQIQQGPVAQDPDLPQMSRLGDEPLTFTAPTGPSSTATQAAPLAETLPSDAGLMGAPGIQETGIPTTSINIDGVSATVPQGLAGQTFGTLNPLKEAEAGSPQAIFERIRANGQLSPELIAAGQARADAMGTTFDPETGFSRDAYLEGQANLGGPMGVDETRARLGGGTLNEYLTAPDGTPGVSGLRTDPQGRMIPAGFETRADAYGDYERDAAAREARLDARPDFGSAISDRERRGTGEMSMADAVDVFGSTEAGRAAILRQRAGLDPVTGKPAQTEQERAQGVKQGQLQNELLQARLNEFQKSEPDKLSKAQAYADRLGLEGDAASAFIFAQMGTSMDDVFGIEGTGAGGGVDGSNANIPQSAIDYLKNNPDAASDFDAKYGAGSSGKYLT